MAYLCQSLFLGEANARGPLGEFILDLGCLARNLNWVGGRPSMLPRASHRGQWGMTKSHPTCD